MAAMAVSSQAYPKKVWIGLTDLLQNDQQFFWDDQSSFDYQNWGENEPDPYGETDECASFAYFVSIIFKCCYHFWNSYVLWKTKSTCMLEDFLLVWNLISTTYKNNNNKKKKKTLFIIHVWLMHNGDKDASLIWKTS